MLPVCFYIHPPGGRGRRRGIQSLVKAPCKGVNKMENINRGASTAALTRDGKRNCSRRLDRCCQCYRGQSERMETEEDLWSTSGGAAVAETFIGACFWTNCQALEIGLFVHLSTTFAGKLLVVQQQLTVPIILIQGSSSSQPNSHTPQMRGSRRRTDNQRSLTTLFIPMPNSIDHNFDRDSIWNNLIQLDCSSRQIMEVRDWNPFL